MQGLLSGSKAVAISTQHLVLAGKDALRFKQDSQGRDERTYTPLWCILDGCVILSNILPLPLSAALKTLMKGAQTLAETLQSIINTAQASEAESAKGDLDSPQLTHLPLSHEFC